MFEDDVVISDMNDVIEGILRFCPRRVFLALNDDHESSSELVDGPSILCCGPSGGEIESPVTNYPPIIINKIMIVLILKSKAGSLWT